MYHKKWGCWKAIRDGVVLDSTKESVAIYTVEKLEFIQMLNSLNHRYELPSCRSRAKVECGHLNLSDQPRHFENQTHEAKYGILFIGGVYWLFEVCFQEIWGELKIVFQVCSEK